MVPSTSNLCQIYPAMSREKTRPARRKPCLWAGPGALAAVLLSVGCAPPTPPPATTETPAAAEPAQGSLPALRYVEVAAASGVSHVYTGGSTYFVGGGVANLDCDADSDADLFVAGGADPSGLFRNVSTNTLAFEPVDSPSVRIDAVIGAYPLDIDSDGTLDLVVLRVGENLLLRGRGDCAFENANAEFSFDGGNAWTTAFSATWEDGNRLPTLAFGNYVDRDDPNGPFNACDDNALVRPAGADASRYAAPVALTGHCTLSMLFTDWNRSGRPSLRVSNDRHYYVRDGEEQLWRMDATPRPYGREDGWEQLRIFGMGIASYDVTGDGYPEYMLTSMADNKLRTLTQDADRPTYDDLAYARGVTAHRPHVGDDDRPSTAWHPEFGDVDNDGFIDLFIAKGNVDAMPEAAGLDPNNLLMGGPDGRFVERSVEAGVASTAKSRGASLVDLDRDGRLDIVVVNRGAPVEIFHNQSATAGNWLQLRLAQPGPNRNGIGAWIDVSDGARTWTREVTVGGGHASGASGWIHFGLGYALDTPPPVSVAVHWPDGHTSRFDDVQPNTFRTLAR